MIIIIISIVGIIFSSYFILRLLKELSTLKRVVLFMLLLSFVTVLLGYFKLSAYAYLLYNSLLLLSTIGILLKELKANIQKNFVPLLVVFIWLISILIDLLNAQFHFEVLSGKLLIAFPLTLVLLAKRKKYDQFTFSWLILFMIHLAIDVYNSYWA